MIQNTFNSSYSNCILSQMKLFDKAKANKNKIINYKSKIKLNKMKIIKKNKQKNLRKKEQVMIKKEQYRIGKFKSI